MASEKHAKLPVTDPLKSQESHQKDSAMTKKGAYAAISYMASAVLLVLFNKAALSSYSFPSANVITLFQMLCSCSILYALNRWKIISFTTDELQSISNNPATLVPFKKLVHSLPLALSYLLYMLITMESVRSISVPMYTTLRRTTVAFTMIVEYFLTGQKHSVPVVGSVGIIILGAFIAGARDLSFDAYGYAVVFVANICTAIYLASIARIGKSSGLNSFGLMWCNGIICGPILLSWTSIRGELQAMLNFPWLFIPGFQVHGRQPLLWWNFIIFTGRHSFVLTSFGSSVYGNDWCPVYEMQLIVYAFFYNVIQPVVMLCSCILAFLINYYVFLNTTLNSALTQTICGNLKDLFTVGLGWVLFGGLPFDLLNVVGQSLGFLGSCLYAYCKLLGK